MPRNSPETEKVFAEFAEQRGRWIPPLWIEPHLVENDDVGIGEGRITFASFVTQVREAGEATWLLHGSAGSGKTSTLAALETELLRSQTPVLLLNAALLRESAFEKDADVRAFVKAAYPPGFPERLWKSRVKRGEVVILLDAANELRREFLDGPTWRFIGKILGGNHGFTVVASSRHPDEEINELRRVRRIRLQGFSPAQVRAYLSGTGLDPDTSLEWLRSVGLADLSSNPQMLRGLTTLVSTPALRDEPPRSRAGLIRRTAYAYIASQRLPPAVTQVVEEGARMDAAWAACATRAHFADSRQFTRRDALALLSPLLSAEPAKTILDFFLEVGPVEHIPAGSVVDAASFALSHVRYAEYGLALGWGPAMPPDISYSSRHFGGFIADWCALQADPAEMVLHAVDVAAQRAEFDTLADILAADAPLLDAAGKSTLWTALGRGFTMARPYRSQLADALASLPRSIVAEGLSYGLLDSMATERPDIIVAVRDALTAGTLDAGQLQKITRQAARRRSVEKTRRGDLGEPLPAKDADDGRVEPSISATSTRVGAAEPGVMAAATDPQLEEPAAAAPELAGFPTDELIAMLVVEDDKPGRVQAARSLRDRTGEAAVLRLGEAAAELTEPAQGHMIGALGRIGAPEFLPALTSFAESETRRVRRKSVTALGLIGGPAALAVIRAKVDDPDPLVRSAAVTALSRCGEAEDVSLVMAELDRAHPETQYPAIGAVARFLNFRGPGDTQPLFTAAEIETAKALLKESNPLTIGRFCKSLPIRSVPDREGLLAEFTSHDSAQVRGGALVALESVAQQRAVTAARIMLGDVDGVNQSAAITVLGRGGEQSDIPAIRSFLRAAEPQQRGATCMALARLGDLESVDDIAVLLDDPDYIVRASACTAVGLLGAEQTVPVLIRRLDDRWRNVRGSAAKALGLLGSVEAVGPLRQALLDEQPIVRGTSAVALGAIADPSVVPALIAIANDTDTAVRRGVVYTLGQIGEPQALTALGEALADPEAEVRWTAATAIGAIGLPSSVPVLLPLLGDPDSHVRGATATALGHIGHVDALPNLIETTRDEVPVVRGSATTALGRIGHLDALDTLLAMTTDTNAKVRSAAITALGRARFLSAIDVVENALDSAAPEVRGAAVRAVARLKPDRDLTPFLSDPDANVRRAALSSIGEGTGAGEADLLLALNDPQEEVRLVAAAALGRRRSAASVGSLESALEDSSPEVGAAALLSLGQVAGRTDSEALRRALNSPHQTLRLTAAELAATRHDMESRLLLEELLHHRDAKTRVAAARALGHLGDPGSAPALVAVLQDADGYVRGTAAGALSRVGAGSGEVREALIARLDDSSEAVVGLAARSLGAIGGPGAPQALQRCALNEAQSIWTRATAVQAAAPLFHLPQTWMRRLAGQYAGSTRPDQVKFRGAITDAVLRGAWDDEVATWAGEVLLTDTDPINQTAAATALGRNRQMTIPLARRFLSPRSGVRDPAAAGAVLRAAIMSAAPDRELLAAAAGLLRQTTMHRAGRRVAAGAALSAVAALDSDSAEGFLGELEARLSEEERARFLPLLQRQREQLDRRLADEAAYRALAGRPERFLTAFSDDVAEGGDMVSESCDIGIVTIIGEEARAVRGWLEGLDPDARSLGPGKRYVYRASCTAGEVSARIVMTQAAEQGQTSAATAAQYLARHFSPRFLILLGIAGGIHSDVGLGDVVIGTHVIDYGPAASTPGGVKHRGAAFRPPLPVVTALNDFFSGVGEPCKLTAHPDSAELGKDSFSLQRGPIGTGPRVVKFKEAEERKFLLDFNEKTLALETEAEAIARHFYEQGEDGELTGYIVLRAISDHADEAKDDKWKLAASRNAVLALQAILPLVMEVL